MGLELTRARISSATDALERWGTRIQTAFVGDRVRRDARRTRRDRRYREQQRARTPEEATAPRATTAYLTPSSSTYSTEHMMNSVRQRRNGMNM